MCGGWFSFGVAAAALTPKKWYSGNSKPLVKLRNSAVDSDDIGKRHYFFQFSSQTSTRNLSSTTVKRIVENVNEIFSRKSVGIGPVDQLLRTVLHESQGIFDIVIGFSENRLVYSTDKFVYK